jgi:hypothetical protein
MVRFQRYLDTSQADLVRLKPSYESPGIPLRVTHPIDHSRSTLRDFRYSEVGKDGRTYLFFEPLEKVQGIPGAPCGKHMRRPGAPTTFCVPAIILQAEHLVVDTERRELRIDSELTRLQNEFQKTL